MTWNRAPEPEDKRFSTFAQFRAVVLWPYDMDLITFYELLGLFKASKAFKMERGYLFSGFFCIFLSGSFSFLSTAWLL